MSHSQSGCTPPNVASHRQFERAWEAGMAHVNRRRASHLGAHLLGHPDGFLQRLLLVAARADAQASARKGHERLVPTLRTPHPRKPLLQIATVQEPLHGPGDDRSPKTIALLVDTRSGWGDILIVPSPPDCHSGPGREKANSCGVSLGLAEQRMGLVSEPTPLSADQFPHLPVL